VKFKTIFILFNAVIVFSFLIIFFMPLLMLGIEYTAVFWTKNWFLPILFLGVLALLNTYFFINRKMFTYLEKEEWGELITLLEDRIFNKHKFINQQIRVLVNAYLVQSDIESIQKLEKLLEENAERKISANALQFGIPYLLKNEPLEMEKYFKEQSGKVGGSDGLWMFWNYAFSLLLNSKKDKAREVLITLEQELSKKGKEPTLLLLTLYLLNTFPDEDREIRDIISESGNRLKKRYSSAEWEKILERSRSNIEVVILSKLVNEAADWIREHPAASGEEKTGEDV